MSIQSDLKSLNKAMIAGTMAMLVREWANCQEAEIDDEGGIWIANPQRGHWLKSDEMDTFNLWLQKQDLDAAQARHNPAWGKAKGVI